MDKQKDLEGNEAGVKKEVVRKLTTKYTADVFAVSVTETGQDQLDKLHEEADVDGLRRWTAKNMKVKNMAAFRAGEEGAAFQGDLEKLVKELSKGV